MRPATTSVRSAGSSGWVAVGPRHHCSAMPSWLPRTSKTRPVTFWAASLHSHTAGTAIQRGLMASWAASSIWSKPGRSAVMRVNAPGARQLTVTPYLTSSMAVMTVKAAMPALAAP